MRLAIAATLVAGLLPVWANASQVTAYGSDTWFDTVKGDNLIDGPHTLNCKNVKGCLLTVSIYITSSTDAPREKNCIFVDSQDVTPKCDYDYDESIVHSKRGFKHVTQGTHTVEFHQLCDDKGKVFWWETEYALDREP